jgi:drug/metabolite transporter (DMT)-like permease
MSKNRRNAYFALLYNAVVWGAAFPFIKPALDVISATEYLYLRFVVAGILSLPLFIWWYVKKRPSMKKLSLYTVMELAGNVIPLLILYEGLDRTSALDASLIGATGPVFVVLGGIIFLKERQEKREWQGLALSLLGSLIIVAEPLILGTHADTASSTFGNMLILSYNIVWAIYAVLAKKIYKTQPPLYFGAITYLGSALVYAFMMGLPAAAVALSHLAIPSVAVAVFYMATLGSVIANICYLYAASKIEVSEANLFSYLNGVVAIPASFLLLGEKPSWLTILAVLIIAYGVIRAETRTKKS